MNFTKRKDFADSAFQKWRKICSLNPSIRAFSNDILSDVKPPKKPSLVFKEQLTYLLTVDQDRKLFARMIVELILDDIVEIFEAASQELQS